MEVQAGEPLCRPRITSGTSGIGGRCAGH